MTWEINCIHINASNSDGNGRQVLHSDMASVLRFEGMTDEEIDNLTLEQYNDIEEQRDQRNAWSVSREVARRVDGASCMGEHIKATTAIEPSLRLSIPFLTSFLIFALGWKSSARWLSTVITHCCLEYIKIVGLNLFVISRVWPWDAPTWRATEEMSFARVSCFGLTIALRNSL